MKYQHFFNSYELYISIVPTVLGAPPIAHRPRHTSGYDVGLFELKVIPEAGDGGLMMFKGRYTTNNRGFTKQLHDTPIIGNIPLMSKNLISWSFN